MGVLRYSRVLERGLEDMFYCWARVRVGTGGLEERFVSCRASDFWRVSGDEKRYTDFVSAYIKPAGYVTVSMRSRETLRNGVFELRTRLPRWDRGPLLWFGFESEDLFGGGCLHFMWDSGAGVLKAFAGGFLSRAEMDLTRFLPTDVSGEYTYYRILSGERVALWYINERLRAVAVMAEGDRRDSRILYDSSPYIVSLVRDRPASRLAVLLDIDGGDLSREYVWEGLHPWSLRVSEAPETPTLYIDLYLTDSDTRLEGLSVSRSVVSAPFPGVLDTKRVYFRASSSGVLRIEGLSGGEWVEYDKTAVESGRRYEVSIEEYSPLYRVVFEPWVEGVVREASVVLR